MKAAKLQAHLYDIGGIQFCSQFDISKIYDDLSEHIIPF